MKCRISELQNKEIVNIIDGARFGFIGDIELDTSSGKVTSLILTGKPRCFGVLGRKSDINIPWSAIQRFGEDLILISNATLVDPSLL